MTMGVVAKENGQKSCLKDETGASSQDGNMSRTEAEEVEGQTGSQALQPSRGNSCTPAR